MKRFRLGDEEIEVDISLAHVLMSISHEEHKRNISTPINKNNTNRNNYNNNHSSSSKSSDSFKILDHPSQQKQTSSPNRMFECKTCNRQFPSFQALGGHRASHKKPKISAEQCTEVRVWPAKPRLHACPICGLKFTIGQALGGHMRRHRAIADGYKQQELEENKVEEESTTLCLDLNLAPPGTPWQNIRSLNTRNAVHKISSMVDCFL